MNQIQQEPVQESQIQTILTDAADQAGTDQVYGMVVFSYRKESSGWICRQRNFNVGFASEIVMACSDESFADAAQKAMAQSATWKEREAERQAICQSCKDNNNAHAERGKNNRRLTDAMGTTFNLCGYRCNYPWHPEEAEEERAEGGAS